MSYLHPSVCPECGREFYPAPQHAYVIDKKKYCRYNCYNTVLKRKEKKSRIYLKSKDVPYGPKS